MHRNRVGSACLQSHAPRQSYGSHFIDVANIVTRILSSSDISSWTCESHAEYIIRQVQLI